MFLGRKVALWQSLVQAAVALGVGFGAPISTEQTGLIMAASAAVLGVITGAEVTRRENRELDTRVE